MKPSESFRSIFVVKVLKTNLLFVHFKVDFKPDSMFVPICTYVYSEESQSILLCHIVFRVFKELSYSRNMGDYVRDFANFFGYYNTYFSN